jgi:hypothetical protein
MQQAIVEFKNDDMIASANCQPLDGDKFQIQKDNQKKKCFHSFIHCKIEEDLIASKCDFQT